MAHYYLDSSGLVKRYMAEAGNARVQGLCARGSGNTIYISRITGVEVMAAIFRRLRMGDLQSRDARAVARRLTDDFGGAYHTIEATAAVVARAMDLAETRALRAYDAIQLGTALQLQRIRSEMYLPPVTFISADDDLNEAAETEGLLAQNPNAHP